MNMRNVLQYLEETALRHPDKTAFTDEEGSITFAELLLRSESLGARISKSLVGRVNRPVGVVTRRALDCVTAFMGVLQSGNFYVPLDADMPGARMDRLLAELRPELVVNPCKKEFHTDRCPILACNGSGMSAHGALRLHALREKVLDIDPAYVIFTSGSTGTPKGIVVSHRALIDFTDWFTGKFSVGPGDVMANQAPFFFDLSVKDLYSTLKCGATTHILPKKLFSFPPLLIEAIRERGVTSLFWATSAFHLVAGSGILEKKGAPETLQKIILGGEALQARLLNVWRRALPGAMYVNLYGPTEVTVDCTYYIIDREFEDGEPIPIGLACENKEILLLDEALRPVPPGESGEICVRGAGLARGYWRDPERTAAAFAQNPLCVDYPDVIYRTGDIGVMRGGLYYYLSRRDGQIKHGGYRVELGEIEAAAYSLDGVRFAVCFYDGEREAIVLAYEGEPDRAGAVSGLRALLPPYMIPSVVVRLDKMPMTPGGKTDRVAVRRMLMSGAAERNGFKSG